MSNLLDCRYATLLEATGLGGHWQDMYYVALGGTEPRTKNITQLEYEWLGSQGRTEEHLNDRWYGFLGDAGYTMPSLQDRLKAWWCDGAPGLGGPAGPAFHGLTPDPITYEMLGVKEGVGDLTTTHTAVIYAPDFEGVQRKFGANEPVWEGGRVVRNYLRNSEGQWTDTTWWTDDGSGGSIDADGVVTLSAANEKYGAAAANSYDIDVAVGDKWIVTVDIELLSGTGELYMRYRTGTWDRPQNETFTLVGRQKISFDYTCTGASVNVQFLIGSANGAQSFQFYSMQVENATGRSDLVTPSEYIKNDQLAQADIPTKVFANANGNTVTNNVVTEAVGAPLPEVPYLKYQPGATNSCLDSNNLEGSAWSANGSSALVKDLEGLTGVPNTGFTITGSSTGDSVSQNFDTTSYVRSTDVFWYRPADSTSVQTYFLVRSNEYVIFNPSTSTFISASANITEHEFIDAGNGVMKLLITCEGVGGTAQALAFIASASGLATLGYLQVDRYVNKTIAEVRGLGPIFTTTAAVSTDATTYSVALANWGDDSGSAFYFEGAHAVETADPAVFGELAWLSHGQVNRPIYFETSPTNLFRSANISFGTASWAGGAPFTAQKLGAVFHAGDAKQDFNEGGNWRQEQAWTEWQGSHIPNNFYIMSYSSMSVTAKMRNLRRYDITSYQEGKDIIDDLMGA